MVDKEFHVKLRNSREDTDIKQVDAAEKLGVKRQAVYAHEKGTSEPSASQLKIYCKLYGKSADYLLGIVHENMISLDGLDDDERKQVVGLIEFFKNRKEK